MSVLKREVLVGALLLLGGCAGGAQALSDGSHAERSALVRAGPAAPSSGFDGAWSVQWCDRSNPKLECGGFWVTLVQEGDRICGRYSGALVNLRQIDEDGRVIGIAVDRTAVLSVESARSGGIAMVHASLVDGKLIWKQVGEIRRGGPDIDVIATDDVLQADVTRQGATLDSSGRARMCDPLPPAGDS